MISTQTGGPATRAVRLAVEKKSQGRNRGGKVGAMTAVDGASDVLLISPWILERSVSPTFQIIREELSYCSSIVTKRVLDRYLNPIEVEDYTDVIRYAKRYPVSLGLLSIASFLKMHGIRVAYEALEIERAQHGHEDGWLDRWLEDRLRSIRPRVIGVGGVTSEIPRVQQLCRLIRRLAPDALIVAGGPHVSFRPLDLLDSGLADIVVHGEGEEAMLEIVELHLAGRPVRGVAGTSTLSGNVLRRGPARSVTDLAGLPQPDYSLLPPEMKEKGIIYAMFTRGCPNKCSYCSEGQLFGDHLRSYRAEAFVDTLEFIANQLNWRFIHIADSTFGLPPQALNALLDELERRSTRFLFSINVRPELHRYLSAKTLRRMRALGFIEFFIGCESGSDPILKAMNRKHTVEDLLTTLRLLKDCGIPFVSTYWMVGLPSETHETLFETMRLIRRLLEEDLVFYASSKPFIPLPGTAIFEHPDSFGIRLTSLDWNLYERYSLPLPYEHPNLSTHEIEAVTLLLQSIQAAVFRRRAGSGLFQDVAQLQKRVERSYEKAVYL